MSKTLKLTGGAVLPVSTIRSIKPITDEDRARMAEKYGKPLEDFAGKNITIQFADKTSKTADLSLDDVRAQGVGLVNLGADRFVPAQNIRQAEPFTKEDAAKLKEGSDYTLSQTFRSRVETTAGTLLSSATPAQVIERREKALEVSGKAAPQTPKNG